MRYLRTTYWSPDLTPFTAVVGEDSVTVPLEEISFDASRYAFVVDDIYETDADYPSAMLEGAVRARNNLVSERNQAIMFFWLHHKFPLLTPGGVLGTERPAPFGVREVRRVFKQLCELKDYRSFTLIATAEDGTPVMMRHGHDIHPEDTTGV